MNKARNKYYDIAEDLDKYPEAWLYIVVGGRNTGKTYGTLKHFLLEDEPIIFVKRTNKDVNSLCAGNRLGKKAATYDIDLSPYKSINRDLGTNVKAFKIQEGLGAFYKVEGKDGPSGKPSSYIASLHAVNDIKGFDLSECEAVVFDEFIPQPWSRIDRKEGEQLADLYTTIKRDRALRGRGELKLILLANAVNIWNPSLEVFGLIDTVAELSIKGIETWYDPLRKIFIRILHTPEEMKHADEGTGIYETMKDTDWGRMAFNNDFGYNDFSRIKRMPLKGYKPLCKVLYKNNYFYIYRNELGYWYVSKSPSNFKNIREYNLKEEMFQRLFYYDVIIDLMNDAIEGKAYFESYSFYDIIVNYKKRFLL